MTLVPTHYLSDTRRGIRGYDPVDWVKADQFFDEVG